jgi:hypothetical protein
MACKKAGKARVNSRADFSARYFFHEQTNDAGEKVTKSLCFQQHTLFVGK